MYIIAPSSELFLCTSISNHDYLGELYQKKNGKSLLIIISYLVSTYL